jgi:hypothetical protein
MFAHNLNGFATVVGKVLIHVTEHYVSLWVFLLVGSFSIQPTPVPSIDLDPSKYKVHLLGSPLGLSMDFDFASF